MGGWLPAAEQGVSAGTLGPWPGKQRGGWTCIETMRSSVYATSTPFRASLHLPAVPRQRKGYTARLQQLAAPGLHLQ